MLKILFRNIEARSYWFDMFGIVWMFWHSRDSFHKYPQFSSVTYNLLWHAPATTTLTFALVQFPQQPSQIFYYWSRSLVFPVKNIQKILIQHMTAPVSNHNKNQFSQLRHWFTFAGIDQGVEWGLVKCYSFLIRWNILGI